MSKYRVIVSIRSSSQADEKTKYTDEILVRRLLSQLGRSGRLFICSPIVYDSRTLNSFLYHKNSSVGDQNKYVKHVISGPSLEEDPPSDLTRKTNRSICGRRNRTDSEELIIHYFGSELGSGQTEILDMKIGNYSRL